MKALRIAFTLFCIFSPGVWVRTYAKNGAYKQTKHGDAASGPQRNRMQPRGSCVQCHDGHAAHEASLASKHDAGLFAPNDNDLCFTCHATPSSSSLYPGSALWSQSTHAKSTSMYLPSSNRTASDANKCVNCHDPHGVRDSNGVVPAMLTARDSELCLMCHNGSRARADISREMSKPFRHALLRPTAHHRPDENAPAAFSAIPATNRHVECSDCHNVHLLGADPAPPFPPQASNRLAGVSRVRAANGGAGMAPTYRWTGADDPSAPNEYEICFKCHSSFTTQPPGQANLALLTNPANPSFHPIQAEGRNAHIDPQAFTNGLSADSIITCTDCHSSDDPTIRGPHGSSYRYLLKKPSTTTTMTTPMQQNDICFECHAFEVYANAAAPADVAKASRFNAPALQGHGYHVGVQQIPCFGCHETHGSTRHPNLIATRMPGMTTFIQTPTGGTCVTTCHTARNYTTNYPR